MVLGRNACLRNTELSNPSSAKSLRLGRTLSARQNVPNLHLLKDIGQRTAGYRSRPVAAWVFWWLGGPRGLFEDRRHVSTLLEHFSWVLSLAVCPRCSPYSVTGQTGTIWQLAKQSSPVSLKAFVVLPPWTVKHCKSHVFLGSGVSEEMHRLLSAWL